MSDTPSSSSTSNDSPDFDQVDDAASTDTSDTASPSESDSTGAYDEVPAIGPDDDVRQVRPPSVQDLDDISFEELTASMAQFAATEDNAALLPLPEVFNAYPPEVQRKLMEWADRDVKARRDDESHRQDELIRATVERDRRHQAVPTLTVILAIICATATGIATGNVVLPVAFVVLALAVVIGTFISDYMMTKEKNRPQSNSRVNPPRVQ